MASFDEGLERYRDDWFRIDQLYRQFTHAYRTFEGPHPLDPLREQVEKRYTNKFVYELGNAWQQQVDEVDRVDVVRACAHRRSFYGDYVEQLVREDKKAVVIISDALRYEVADELGSRIRQEDRFDADLDAVLGVLPSYTQLGMAALLPHRTLEHSAGRQDRPRRRPADQRHRVRDKILESGRWHGDPGRGLQGSRAREERRELFKSNQVLYVYHNRSTRPVTSRAPSAGSSRPPRQRSASWSTW